MGWGLFVQMLPLAVGAAISPAVLTVQILVLSSGAESIARAWGLAIGRMAALLAVSLAGASLLAQLPDFNTGQPSLMEGAIALLGGLALLLVTGREWRWPRPSKDRTQIARRVVGMNPWVLFAFGAGWMLVNVSTLALYLPALHMITSSDSDVFVKAVAFLALFLLASAVVLVPTLAVSIWGDQARPLLAELHARVSDHSHSITLVVCAVFGLALIVWGTSVLVRVL